MQKQIFFIASLLLITLSVCGQPPKTPPKELPTTIPKHETGTPGANPQPIKKAGFHKYITTVTWEGARIWRTQNATTVDSVTTMNFSLLGTVTWNKQGWEYVTRTAGTYTVNGNSVKISFSYPPYTHHIDGIYDPVTGKITGTFREERAPSANAPSAYVPGTTTGEIVLYKK